MTNISAIKELLESHFKDSVVKVGDLTGTDDHLDLFIATDEFQGKMLIDQHQMVMDILKEPLKTNVHAVKIKTMTLKKYEETK